MTSQVEIHTNPETDEFTVSVIGQCANDFDKFSTYCENEANDEAQAMIDILAEEFETDAVLVKS